MLALRPADAAAQANLALCERLLGESGGAPLGKAQQSQLLTSLREQKRLIEAAPLAAILDPDIALAKSAILARLREARKLPGWKDDERVIALPDGTFKVSLKGLAPIDFSVLKDQPVSVLDLERTSIADLSSLAGLPLKELILSDARATDLSPLRGMMLRTLNLRNTKISDLSPLTGMPLTDLNCDDCKTLKDISPLHGAPLVNLTLLRTGVASIAPVVGAPLKYLVLEDTKVADFALVSQFEGLEKLSLVKLPITDLAPLAKMHLTSLDCRFTMITSIEPLRGQPLRFLNLGHSGVTDLSLLADCTTLEEFIPPNAASDLTPLRKLAGLKRISTRKTIASGDPPWYTDQPAEEYWKKYDALQAAGGWEDLLAQLTPAEVDRIGQGWSLKDGELASPDNHYARLPLPGVLSGASFQVRIKLRRLAAKEVFYVALPVGDKMVGFELDGWAGTYTGLQLVNGRKGKDLPGIVEGQQVKDSEPHDLEVTVRLDGDNATITTTLDTRPLYEWTGPIAALSQNESWATKPGALALGTMDANWVVSEVKVKRLEKKP